MSKPFSIQSPESIAKEYGGNKQRIAQAAQLGIVDPTAAVMAGMFIDRMRSAQMEEGAQKPTVAQQVMGGAPASPPVPPSGGLGATPQAAPPMAPQQPAPPPQGAPMGMADGGSIYAAPYTQGGLDSLPLPDTMFDESSNGGFDEGYAGGGLVAFADGGLYRRPDDYEAFQDWATRIIRRESGGRYGVLNAEGSGAMGVGQIMPDTGRALARVAGLDWRPDLMRGTSPEAKHYQDTITGLALREAWNSQGGNAQNASGYYFAGPNRRGWNAKTRAYIAGTAGGSAPSASGARAAPGAPAVGGLGATAPAETLTSAIPDAFKAGEEYYAANMPERKNEGLGLLTEEARRVLDPAEQKKRRNEDKWMMLAEIGFNMAASNSPYLLQAASAAAAAALPGARAAKKEREAEKREAIRDLAAAEDITYKQAAEKTNFIREFATMQLGLKDKDLTRDLTRLITTQELQNRLDVAHIQVQGQKDVEGIRASSYRDYNSQQNAQLERQARLQAPQLAATAAQQDRRYQQAMRAGKVDEAQGILNQYTQYYLQQFGVGGGAQAAPAANAGQGRTVSQGRIINAVPIPQ